jgi:histidinol-phosphate aminotransferase
MPRALPNNSAAGKPLPKPGILDIAPYVGGKSKAAPGVRVAKLSSNETPLGASPLAKKAFAACADTLHRYPDGSAAKLREAIAEVYKLPPELIACGAGSDELIGLLIHAYAGVGDEILMSEHGFLMYKIYAQGFGVSVVAAPEKTLRADIDAMLAKVTLRTKIVFIANPNNPTGSYVTKAEIKRLHEALPPHVLLVIDAAYSEYVDLQDYSDGSELVEGNDNVVVLHTFSKIYGLSALRLGWAYGPAHVIDVLNRIRGPFNVSTPAIEAGVAAVRDIAFTKSTRQFNNQWLAWLSKEISALGLKVYPSIANFVLVEFKDGKHSAASANQFLTARGLIVRDVAAYGLPQALRISVGLEEDNRAVVAALKDFLKA